MTFQYKCKYTRHIQSAAHHRFVESLTQRHDEGPVSFDDDDDVNTSTGDMDMHDDCSNTSTRNTEVQ